MPLRDLPRASGFRLGLFFLALFLAAYLILFGFIAVLEDCGYMARAAFLMDRLMSKCGLSGKSFIPMLSSVALVGPSLPVALVPDAVPIRGALSSSSP